MGRDDLSGKPLPHVVEQMVESTARSMESVADAAAGRFRKFGDTLDLGVAHATGVERSSFAGGDTPTLELRRPAPDSDAEGVDYWDPDSDTWGESSSGRFDTVEMGDGYIGEDIPGGVSETGVRYLRTEAERLPFRLDIRDGVVRDAQGNLFDTRNANVRDALGRRLKRAIFVMDEHGNIYASLFAKRKEFQHSSFLAGGPVAGAGEIVVENGVIKLITDQSGHYLPTQHLMRQVLTRLEECKVRLRPDQVRMLATE
ncbi:hypothetical protein [Nocardia testacea]|uniref:Uncharacterized protein n=1 Tax=Nocardia testacea TaxID=248551 RepID=A0ABW7W6Y2_9NOCA